VVTIDQSIGLVAHLKLNDILKGRQGVYFELVAVGLNAAQHAAQTLHDLKALDLSDAFTIAAPSVSPSPEADVEQPGGGDDRTAAPSPSPTLKEFFDWIDANPLGVTIDIADLAPTIDELRAFTDPWPQAEKQAIKAFLDGKDNTNPAVVLDAIVKARGFGDVVTTPAPRVAPVAATLPTAPDEGDDADDDTVDRLSKRHARLDADGKSFVAAVIAEAAAGGLECHMGGEPRRRTRRRHQIMAGLVALADGLANDDALRGCVAAAIGGEIADSKAWTWGQIVGCMNADEAAVFASAAEALSTGQASLRFIPQARVEVSAA
jgi:hypothetical protein